MRERYTIHGSELFESWLKGLFEQLITDAKSDIGDCLVSMILTGAFGRGEGASYTDAKGEARIFGDLDILVIVKNRKSYVKKWLAALQRRYAEDLGIMIDFSGPFFPIELRLLYPELSSYSILNGSIALYGTLEELHESVPLIVWSNPWVEEAARLLLCRGATLLKGLRACDGLETVSDVDIVRRYYWRVVLGLGDALLIANYRFTIFLAERLSAYKCLEDSDEQIKALKLASLYEKAIQFKLKPDSFSPEQPTRAELEELVIQWGTVFLTIERKRFSATFKNMREYVGFRGIRERNNYKRNVRHKRERLYLQLPELLGLTGKPSQGQEWTRSTEAFLKTHRANR